MNADASCIQDLKGYGYSDTEANPTSATGAKSLGKLLKVGVGHQKVFTTSSKAWTGLLTRTG
jgi:hypothetical protein